MIRLRATLAHFRNNGLQLISRAVLYFFLQVFDFHI
jgi:hypothetical protein